MGLLHFWGWIVLQVRSQSRAPLWMHRKRKEEPNMNKGKYPPGARPSSSNDAVAPRSRSCALGAARKMNVCQMDGVRGKQLRAELLLCAKP